MDEPRYFVAPSENKVAHVNAGILSSELCAALGITSSHLMPPPYLANMIREGYPPGFVGIDGEPAKMESEEETLRFICGGEEMDLSDEDHEDGLGKRGPTDFSAAARSRKAVMTVVFPGAFGAPPPPGVDPSLWEFPRRVSQHGESAASRAPSQMHFSQAQKQAQLQLQQAQLQLQKVQAQLQLQQGGGQSFLQHEMSYTPAHSHEMSHTQAH